MKGRAAPTVAVRDLHVTGAPGPRGYAGPVRAWIALGVVAVVVAALFAACGTAPVAEAPTGADGAVAAAGRRDAAPRAEERRRTPRAAPPAAPESGPPPSLATFPPFTPRGGPLLVRFPVAGRAAVLEPEGDGAWHEIGDDAARRPVAWVAPDVVLLQRVHGPADEEPCFGDLRTGVARPALPGRRSRVVAVRDGGVVLHDLDRGALVRTSPGDALRPIPFSGIAELLSVAERHAFVRAAAGATLDGPDSSAAAPLDAGTIVRVPFDGSPANALPLVEPRGDLRMFPSPGGTRIAVAPRSPWLWPREQAPEAPPHLRILDASTGAEIWRVERVPLHVAPESSIDPTLAVSWPDEDRIRWSESYRRPGAQDDAASAVLRSGWADRWVEASAATGERLREVPYRERLGIRHETPPTAPTLAAPEWPLRWGLFRTTYRHTFLREDPTPAIEATWSPGAYSGNFVSVSPDGRWAAACATEDGAKVVVLLDGRDCSRRVVHRGDLAGLGWIGAAK